MNDTTKPCKDEQCGVCVRRDMNVVTDYEVQIVTYVGDYVVMTGLSPELQDPMIAMLQQIGIVSIPTLALVIGYVGEGSVGDSKVTVPDEEFVRYIARHSNVDDPKGPHDMLVEELKAGTLDVSTPIPREELEEASRKFYRDGLDNLDGFGSDMGL
jgi:hypothetical protein